jgi:hypothetical protein
VRCKYCTAVLTLTADERTAAEDDLGPFAERLG